LWKVNQNIEILISDFQGGNKHNAIPRESSSVIVVQQAKLPLVKKILQKELKAIQIEYKPIDPKLTLHINETSLPTSVLDIHSSTNLLQLLQALPHGVDKMNYDISKLVDTSTNLATLDIHDKKAVMLLSTRSSIMSALQDFRDRIHAIAMLAGAEVEEDDPYPGWKPNIDSKLLKLSKKIFKDIYKTDPKVEAIHAGLECGIIGEKYPGMDMISIGPTIKYPHSPEEQVHISTVDKFYYYLLRILESV
ncbi:MAG: M20/M25/M40 family metallo-hydrolase, partial [Candidatus Thermoplasmatota archaeon]|nr:M20/M25/M40 family metallo-hydrolase [Candidatus Thermoplasmatota archaeon]